jgi:hypothetical protein
MKKEPQLMSEIRKELNPDSGRGFHGNSHELIISYYDINEETAIDQSSRFWPLLRCFALSQKTVRECWLSSRDKNQWGWDASRKAFNQLSLRPA